MNSVSTIFLLAVFAGAASPAGAQGAVSKCFRADWLQGERVVNFRVDGNRVTGTFAVGGGDESRPDATYEFGGTLAGDTLTVAFTGGRLPEVAPSEMTSLSWKLIKAGGRESLRIKFRGENYQTNEYEDSFVDFAPCDSGYAALAKAAKRIRFARGANSASFPVEFKTEGERRFFLLNMRAGQRVEVEAPGCAISFYRPDKRAGEEPAIDVLGPERLTQGGDYLFAISPAPSPGRYSVSFKVTN